MWLDPIPIQQDPATRGTTRREVLVGQHQVLIFGAALLALSACRSYQPAELPRPDARPQALGDQARITTADGRTHELVMPVVMRDSIVGEALADRSRRVALALADVQRVEVHQYDAEKTIRFTTTTLGLAGVVMLLSVMKCITGGCD